MNAVETRGLSKRYRMTWALRDCALSVPTGRVSALVGPNGAGKTTLLHCLVGLCRPSAGRVTVAGDLIAGSPEALGVVAFVAQNAPLVGYLSVAATVSLAALSNASFDRSLATDRLAELGIPPRRRVGRLSGGQQAQLALSIALARRPRVLVLDEPLAPLDPLARHEFMAYLMAQVAEQGLSVVFSSHVVAELERVADHLIVLADGHVQVAGDIEDLLSDHSVWSGPAGELDAVGKAVTIVHTEPSGRVARALVRHGGAEPPVRWDTAPIGVEELVLAYLRTPSARVLPHPYAVAGAQGASR